LNVAQLVPEKPAGQTHIYEFPLDWHVAPFKQGLLEHALKIEQVVPLNPEGHIQIKEFPLV